ncbi:NAD-dependent epimerase/dehydratase family protein [Pararoseomonas indoligenes]|uniref:NAD-dependent epimerase/dehydratase family protein n=1 Tax=Roseomonas indoligenes TaxID=2820811 RepID=A0A940S6Y5_9PROT|nr:NAD-dependent epimerase/dehydratase family protein [Pararoseomonas indoligenes]MBP0494395.1 NAD-dependent epimerase/dehydratase family protein [Pararoseomonas indoligenes]
MKAVVTGSSGFLGGMIAAGLAADPRVDAVTGLDRVAAPAGAPFAGIRGEVARIPELVPAADLVVHAAAITTQASEDDPDLAYAINVEGTRAVLRWARAQPRPPRVVLLSSVAVFGAGDAVATEATPPDPRSAYGTTKLIAERLMMDATRRGEVDGVVLRLPVVVVRTGARTAPPGAGFVSAYIDAALRELPCTAPFTPGHAIPVASYRATVGLILRAALEVLPERLLHVPSLAASAESTRDALVAQGVEGRIECRPDPAVQALVAGWPERLETLHPDFSADLADAGLGAIISEHAIRLGRVVA